MKKQLIYITGLLLVLAVAACKKDNYSAPGVTFKGRITYQGEPVGVGLQPNVYVELWQSGFGKLTPINVNVATDGSFSALLFNGTYKLDLPNGQGPYLPASGHYGDTTTITISGDKTMDIEVLPYFMIRNPQYTASTADSTITATFKLDSIIKDAALVKGVERVYLVESTLALVDQSINKGVTAIDGATLTDLDNITLSVKVPADQLNTQHYFFTRVGVKISGVEDLLYAPVVKIQF